MSELPGGWTRAQLHQLMYSIEAGLNVKCDERPPLPGEPGLVKISAVTWGKFDELQSKTLPSTFEPDERNRIRSGDLLISRANTIELVGACVIVGPVERRLYLSDKVLRLLVHQPSKRWINYVLKTPELRKAIEKASAGNQLSMRNISQEKLRALEIPLAPEPEQQRIANQLDTLLTRIQSCNDRFDAIPALLKRFRQAVLDVATSGQLTADWRAGGVEKWEYLRAGDVCAKVQSGGTPKEGFTGEGIPFLKVYNIVNQKVAFDYKPQYISKENHARSMSKSQTQPGDVLMNIVGPPLGKVAIVTDAHPTWNINQALTLFRPSNRITTGWLYYVLCGGKNIAEIEHQTRGSAGQVNISLSQCRNFVFPVPPVAEQTEIVRRVEALFALADRIEARATAARTQAQRLSPLVLAKAFRGELVQQDPQDEPASVLLQRLAATQPAKAKASRGRPRTKTQELFAAPEGVQPDVAGLPDGVWAAPDGVDEHAVTAMLVAVLQAWGGPMPQMQARLAAVLCLQPRQMTAVLPTEQAAQWQRLVGPAADPLPAQVARLQPATDSAWRKALGGMRARGDLVEEGSGPQATWALGNGAGQIETAGWPQGRAGWVVAYLRAHGAEAILPLLEPLTVEFVHARAA